MPLKTICFHAVLVAVQIQGSVQGPFQTVGIVVMEYNTGSRSCCRIEMLNRVSQTAGGTHHRHRAVPEAVHLVQAARLVT